MKKQFNSFKVLFLLLAWAFGMHAYAQEVKITGTATDAADGKTLPGVTVLVKGTTRGTTTDLDGRYGLNVNVGSTLVFSYIGYTTQEIVVGAQRTIDVMMSSSTTGLSEVVVIGYGQVKKTDATGAVRSVSTKDFNKGAMVSPQQLLVGKVAGVQVTTANGAPGGDATIRIRGGSSLQASNDPLVVIDGVPVDNSSISGVRSPLSTINANEIETFTVLKDASATAIYGARASNGVILITTKKGGDSDKPKVEYSGNVSLYAITKTIDVLGADEFRTLVNQRYAGNDAVLSLLGTASTDWQKEIYRNAVSTDHNISISGKYDRIPYRFSAGYLYQDGILKTDNMQRTSIGINMNPSVFDDHLKINWNNKWMFIKNKFADNGAIGSAIQFDPTQPVTDENAYGGYWAWIQPNGKPVDQATDNPVARLNLRDDEGNALRYIGNVQLDYKFHFLPDLRANLNVGYDYSTSNGTVFVPAYSTTDYYDGGIDRKYDQIKENSLLDFYLNYDKEVKSIASRFNIMGGYSWQHFYQENNTYNNDVAHSDAHRNTVVDKGEYYLVSFFGRFNYTLLDRYLLTFTLRDDGSSRFSKDTRWGLFPSAALAWKLNEEFFLKNVDVLSTLKLRVGYGITGQQDIPGGNYPYLPRYTYSDQYAMYQLGNSYYYTLRPEGYDANIKWEETTTKNIGLDFGFLNDRINGSIEYYVRETKDLINKIPVAAGTNLSNYIVTNVGDMENKGFEFDLNFKPVVKKDFLWEVGLNASANENEITKLTANQDPSYVGVLVGGISGGVGNTIQVHSVGYPMYSFFVYQQVYGTDGLPLEGVYVDRNKDGVITDADRYRYKSPNPEYTLAISSRLNYKKWDFSFSGRANFNNYVYDNVNSNNGVYERLFRSEGPYLSNIASSVYDVDFIAPQYLSDYFIKNASFFKMDYISVGYLFDHLCNDKAQLRLSATVNNAFTITKYEGIDPEIYGGIDNNIYPRPRVFALGLNLTF